MNFDRREFLQHSAVTLGWASFQVGDCAAAEIPRGTAAGARETQLTAPVPYQVFQRRGFDPRQAHDHAEGGPRRGGADIDLAWTTSVDEVPQWQARVVCLEGAFGVSTQWIDLEATQRESAWQARVRIEAGGWYRLELRGVLGTQTVATGAIEPVGVGEVFVVAGQSYAEGANDELLRVTEPAGRVTALDFETGSWQIAHDPQPRAGTGGTIWPHLGVLLVPLLQVPVGFVNVAVGGTAIRQWQPGEQLFDRLLQGARGVGDFRAVLWQQGESDVIEKTPTETYCERLRTLRSAFAQKTGGKAPWLLAQSTMHPTVYNDPAGEGRIRRAIESLWEEPGFARGPNTDLLTGETRGGLGTRRHFTGVGQRRAAQLWFAALWNELQHPRVIPKT
ncbi:MAG: sialate O-acetylesterase [Planctomycetaceae bacterium]